MYDGERKYLLVELLDRKLAHWLRFDLPRMMTPALRNLAATPASRGTLVPSNAKDPAKYLSALRSSAAC